MLRFLFLAGCAGLMALTTGCGGSSSSAADAKIIQANSEKWSKAGGAKDAATFGSFYADDAVVMMPNEPIFKGMENIKNVLQPMMQDPNFALTFTTDKVEVSGILAYSQGTLSHTSTGRDGKPLTDTCKYVAVWKKQPDGSWKAIEHIFNSDLPPAGS